MVVALGISIFAEPTIRLMSAPQFYAAAVAVPLLTLGMFFSCLSNFASFSLLVSEKTSIINRNSYITVAIISVLNLIFIPRFGQVGAALALMLSLGSQFFIIHSQARKYYDMHIRIQPLLAMIGVAVLGFVLAQLVSVSGNLLIDVAVRLLIYAVFSLALVGMLWRDAASRAHMMKLIAPLLTRFGLRSA
jgi:O-antigen/teichoic acid export membrane protein